MTRFRLKPGADDIVGPKVDRLGRALGLEMHKRLVERTPVDTGHARANWNLSVDRPDASVNFTRSAQFALTRARLVSTRFRMSAGDVLWASNDVSYIVFLDKGSSTQAPAGMTALVKRELAAIARRLGADISRRTR